MGQPIVNADGGSPLSQETSGQERNYHQVLATLRDNLNEGLGDSNTGRSVFNSPILREEHTLASGLSRVTLSPPRATLPLNMSGRMRLGSESPLNSVPEDLDVMTRPIGMPSSSLLRQDSWIRSQGTFIFGIMGTCRYFYYKLENRCGQRKTCCCRAKY